MNRFAIYVLAAALFFGAGVWVGTEWEEGQEAQREQAEQEQVVEDRNYVERQTDRKLYSIRQVAVRVRAELDPDACKPTDAQRVRFNAAQAQRHNLAELPKTPADSPD